VIALWKVVRLLGPGALEILVDLVRAAATGETPAQLARRAEKLAHRIAFEEALKAARRG
jgi:hypothetical protein